MNHDRTLLAVAFECIRIDEIRAGKHSTGSANQSSHASCLQENLPLCSVSFWEIPPSQLSSWHFYVSMWQKFELGVNVWSTSDHVLITYWVLKPYAFSSQILSACSIQATYIAHIRSLYPTHFNLKLVLPLQLTCLWRTCFCHSSFSACAAWALTNHTASSECIQFQLAWQIHSNH